VRPEFIVARAKRNETGDRRAWWWTLAVAATIFAESCRSNVAEPGIVHVDKYAHFLVYGLLATLVYRARRGKRGAAWMAIAAASVYGVTDEWHQSFVPGRSTELADWISDTLGAALAVSLYAGWAWYRALLEMSLGRNRRIEKPAAVANLRET
jgi:VanZ family protein